MNKNTAIFILVVLIIISGIWGSLADRKRIVLEKKLQDTAVQLQKLTEQSGRQHDLVLSKTAELQETLTGKEEQLGKARKELVSLRKESQALESQLSACNATIQQLSQEKNALENALRTAQGKGLGDSAGATAQLPAGTVSSPQENGPDAQTSQAVPGESDVLPLRDQLQAAELDIDRLRRQLETEKALMMGLEKLLEEKDAAMRETSQEMDRLKINMDVLLSKIADQRDELQEIHAANRVLVKELAARNEEAADLREEVMRQPVQE